MILAAGKGSRLKPFTLSKPKVLLEILDVPLLEYVILYLKYHGVEEIIINIHHHAEQIIDFLRKKNQYNIRIEISDESDELLNTGGGLKKVSWFFDDNEPFFLVACDVITNLDLSALYAYHLLHKPIVTLAVKQRKSTRELLFDERYNLIGWKSNITGDVRQLHMLKNPVKIAFSAIQIIEPVIFDLISEEGSFSLIDVYLRLARDHFIKGFEHNQSHWFEFGRKENFLLRENEEIIRGIYNRYF